MSDLVYDPACHPAGFVPPCDRPHRARAIIGRYTLWTIWTFGLLPPAILFGNGFWAGWAVMACLGLAFAHIPYLSAKWDGVGSGEVFAAERRRIGRLSDRELLEYVASRPTGSCSDY
jgi:hypothetical protein